MISREVRSSALVLALLATAAAKSAEYEPALSAALMHTDNLTMDPTLLEPQTVLRVVPSLRVRQNSPRLTADAEYDWEGYRYSQRKASQIFDVFDGTMKFGMIPDKFFLEAGASRSSSIRDPDATIPVGNFAISANRLQEDQYYLGPTFQAPAGGNAVITGGVRRTWSKLNYESAIPGLESYDSDAAQLAIDNYRKGHGFTWAWRYNYEDADYGDQFAKFEFRRAVAEFGFWAGQSTRLFAAAGRESPWNNPTDAGLKDSTWEMGVAEKLGERLTAQFAAGHRSFGSSRRGELNYSGGRIRTTFSYYEQPTTNARDRYNQGGLLAATEPIDYLARPTSAERYVQKRLQWTFNVSGPRRGLSVVVYNDDRKDRARLDGTPLPEESQKGADLSFNWSLGPRTELVFGGSVAKREFAQGSTGDLTTTAVAANHKLGRKSLLSLSYRQWRDKSDEPLYARDVSANLVSLVFSRTW
jgi:hypothetical protein